MQLLKILKKAFFKGGVSKKMWFCRIIMLEKKSFFAHREGAAAISLQNQ
jgi:hypothetical protein